MKENYLSAWEEDWKQYRSFLISFAYRMTGSLSEAEDLVQDTFLECANAPPAEVRNPKSGLTRICANKGIDHLKSAYKKRETYPGTLSNALRSAHFPKPTSRTLGRRLL